MGFGNAGKVWSVEGLQQYLAKQQRPLWGKGITFHHCAEPSLAQRPKGFLPVHLENLKDFYQNQLGWSSAPHLFIDEDQCWGMCPFEQHGIHASSFNATHLGIEVLGNYDIEDPRSGRGLECWETAFVAAKVLLDWLQLPVNESTINFHRDDPKTSKTCPGTKVTKAWVLGAVANAQVRVTRDPWFVRLVEANDTRKLNVIAREVNGRVIVPIREAVIQLGGNQSLLAQTAGKKGFTYDGKELEFAYIEKGTGYAPIREITDALGLKILDTSNHVVLVGK